MTAQEFLISKGVKSIGNQFPAGLISKWLEEYANIVLDIAAEKAEIIQDTYTDIISVDKNSILDCLK